MNGNNVRKAFENCRDEIFNRITKQKTSDWNRTWTVSSEMVSAYVESILKTDIGKIEKIVRKRLKELEAQEK